MDETTTTEEVVQPTGADEALPVVDDAPTADAPVIDEPSDNDTGVEEPTVPVDEKLQNFAKGQGIDDISELSERELKLLKVAKDNQAEYQRNRQKATELEKSVVTISDEDATATARATGQDPELLKTVQRMEVKSTVRDFWDTPLKNGDLPDKGLEQQMISIVNKKPYLAGDLTALYANAVFDSGTTAAVKSQGKREALQSLAHKQQAAVPTGSATRNGTPKEKPFAELSIAEMEKKLGVVRQ